MKTEIKALIVFAVLVLSAGPLMYFFGENPTGQPQGDETTAPEVTYKIENVKLSGEITELDDYIIYNGITPYDNPGWVNKTLFETIELDAEKDEVLATAQLNDGPEGGYKYHIKIKIPAGMTAQELGLRLAHELKPFFQSTDLWPIRMGKVQLPEKANIKLSDNETETISFDNKTVQLVALYWQKEGNKVPLYCSRMKFDKDTEEYLGSSDACYDITPTQEYGFTEEMIDVLKEKTTVGEYPIEDIRGVYFEAEERASVSVSEVFDALTEEYYTENTIKVRVEDSRYKIDAQYIDENATEYIQTVLENELELNIKNSFKEGLVSLPFTLKIGENEYILRNAQLHRIKLDVSKVAEDMQKVKIYVKSKYGQVLDIWVEGR